MSEHTVRLVNLGKKYRLFSRQADKVLDSLGVGRLMFWRKKRVQDFWALRELNLEFRKGERVGIIGRNGAGKSTLLKIVCGNLQPTEGRVEVAGQVQALMELGTGFHPEFTGRENVKAALAYQGLSPAQVDQKLDEILDFSELEAFIDQPIRTYSSGMYARLAFATATSVAPEVLIIDEILSAGDAYFSGKCLERMRSLTERVGATVLFVSHDLSSVQRLCERAVWIDRGRVRRDGASLDVIKEYSAVVRQEEELRLRARDMKVRKKQAVDLQGNEDIYRKLLFHLVPADGVPLREHARVYGIRLMRGSEELAGIAAGSPMDNSPAYPHYLLTDPGFMDWGPAGTDAGGAFRLYGSFGGKYAHAPFEMAVPKSCELADGAGLWTLEVEAQSPEPVAVEFYDGQSYRRLGVLQSKDKQKRAMEFRPQMSAAAAAVPASPEASQRQGGVRDHEAAPEPRTIHEYGTLEAKITAVRMYNSEGVETRVLTAGLAARVELDYETSKELLNPFFVFCVYLPDGQCASQWGFSSQDIGVESIRGVGRVAFKLSRLHLGRSAYVASAAIFKRRRSDSLEAESYHVLDRCIHFQVLPQDSDAMAGGLCLQPFEAELSNG